MSGEENGPFQPRIGGHCAVADDQKQVWVCDPRGGRVLVVKDTMP